MSNNDPDALLKTMDKKGIFGDLMVSIVLHLLVIGLTSFGLYASWAKWGVHSPSQIKVLEKAAAKEAAKAEQKAKEEAAAAAAATNEVKAAQTTSVSSKVGSSVKEEEKPRELPLDKQIESPPKSFDLDEISL